MRRASPRPLSTGEDNGRPGRGRRQTSPPAGCDTHSTLTPHSTSAVLCRSFSRAQPTVTFSPFRNSHCRCSSGMHSLHSTAAAASSAASITISRAGGSLQASSSPRSRMCGRAAPSWVGSVDVLPRSVLRAQHTAHTHDTPSAQATALGVTAGPPLHAPRPIDLLHCCSVHVTGERWACAHIFGCTSTIVS